MDIMAKVYRLPRVGLIFLIELYRTWVSPTRMPTCRFEPTCSGYAVEALSKHGFLWGSVLATWRLLKCGPWHKPGYDPVPELGPVEWLRSKTSNSDAEASPSDRGK